MRVKSDYMTRPVDPNDGENDKVYLGSVLRRLDILWRLSDKFRGFTFKKCQPL